MAPSRNPLARLQHVRDEIDQLTRAMAGIVYEDFAASYVYRRTVEHAVLIISEAVRSLPDELLERYPGPNWRAMRGIGNVLRHDDFAIEPTVLWDVVSTHLPALSATVERMIADRVLPGE